MKEDEFGDLVDFDSLDDDLDDVDPSLEVNDEDYSHNQDDEPDHNDEGEDEDYITQILRSKGIEDTSKIKFENEDGEIEERSWDDLTNDEKVNILNENVTIQDYLDDDEIALINHIRNSKMSVGDYLAFERQQGVAEYANQQNPPTFMVDDFDDDELFKLDLMTKVGEDNISDEELEEALQAAKASPLFEKQMAGVRNEYRNLEEQRNEQETAIKEQEEAERYAQFSNSIINSIQSFNNLGDLDITLEDDDANQLYDYITGTDAAGINHFAKALNDPDTLVQTAWFALHGTDVINSISNYYKKEIAKISKQNYDKGYNDAKNGNKSSVVVNKQNKKTSKNNVSSGNVYDISDVNYEID